MWWRMFPSKDLNLQSIDPCDQLADEIELTIWRDRITAGKQVGKSLRCFLKRPYFSDSLIDH